MYPVYQFCTYDHAPNPGCPDWTPRIRCVGKWAIRQALRSLYADAWDRVTIGLDLLDETDPGPPRCEEIPLPANFHDEVSA
jgi:hypothetical protein